MLLLENGPAGGVLRHGPSHILEWRIAEYELLGWGASARCVAVSEGDRVAKNYQIKAKDVDLSVRVRELAPTADQTTGLGVWDASIALALILASQEKCNASTVLEIGCGLALPTAALAQLRASADNLFATDASQYLIDNIDVPNAYRLDWGNDDHLLPAFITSVDMLIGAEVLYVASAVPKLVRLIRRCSPRQVLLTALARRKPLLLALAKSLQHEYQDAEFHDLTLVATSPDPVSRITVDDDSRVELTFLDLRRR